MVDRDCKPLIEQPNEGLRDDWSRIELVGPSEQPYFQVRDGLGGDRGDETSQRMSEMPVGSSAAELFAGEAWQVDGT